MDIRTVRTMKPLIAIAFTLAMAVVSANVSLASGPPSTISYQGILTNSAVPPVVVPNGNYNLTFKLYFVPSGVDPEVWTETQNNVPVTEGRFNVELGITSSLTSLDFSTNYYLGISVNGGAELPRIHVTAVSNSFYSDRASRVTSIDGATGGNVTSKVSIGPGHTHTGLNSFTAGESNSVTGQDAAVPGGSSNNASGLYSAIGGGESNVASNRSAAVPGGAGNTASGFCSFAAGHQAKSLHNGSFVWADDAPIADFASTAANQFLIRARGGVGIGTNSPGRAFGAAQSLSLSAEGEGLIEIIRSGAVADASNIGQFAWTNDANNAGRKHSLAILGRAAGASATDRGADMIFYTKPNTGLLQERMRIVASGAIGIGTPTPAYNLDVVGNIRVSGMVCYGSLVLCSDARFKQNVKSIEHGLDLVSRLRPVRFDWRRDEFPERKFSDARQIGFIAQELKEVVPEVVAQGPDGYLTVDYSRLAPILVEAIQELKAKADRVDTLEKQVRDLKLLVEKFVASDTRTPDRAER